LIGWKVRCDYVSENLFWTKSARAGRSEKDIGIEKGKGNIERQDDGKQ
jgi:hypothetical protein